MCKSLILCFILSLFSGINFAEIYKCDEQDSTRFSTHPCSSNSLQNRSEINKKNKKKVIKEQFVVPVYSAWKGGWKKVKKTQLEHFYEIEYLPVENKKGDISVVINHQALTTIPDFVSVEHFATSVSDIIESICESAIIHPANSFNNVHERVFYGQYSCALRRDTKKGQLGLYKIMRGEKSVYMLMIKWNIPVFDINNSAFVLQQSEIKKRQQQAEEYLKNEIKVCNSETCF